MCTLCFCFPKGVVLTLAIPPVTSGTGAGTLKSSLVPMGSAHGHTGHVRFLTSIELPEGFDMNFPPTTTDSAGMWNLELHFYRLYSLALTAGLWSTGNPSQSSSTVEGGLQRRNSAHRRTSAHISPKTNHLVISGGDGYEDFRLTNSSETVGRDDSTNHLLLWRVWDDQSLAALSGSDWFASSSPSTSSDLCFWPFAWSASVFVHKSAAPSWMYARMHHQSWFCCGNVQFCADVCKCSLKNVSLDMSFYWKDFKRQRRDLWYAQTGKKGRTDVDVDSTERRCTRGWRRTFQRSIWYSFFLEFKTSSSRWTQHLQTTVQGSGVWVWVGISCKPSQA